MLHRLNVIARAIRRGLARRVRPATDSAVPFSVEATFERMASFKRTAFFVGSAAIAGWLLYAHMPVQQVARGELGVRTNQFTGTVTQWREGRVFVLPGLFDMRMYSLRDQVWRPEEVRAANGPAPLQSAEGLSVGVDLAVRYALDPTRIAANSRSLPDNIAAEIVEPAVQGVIYKVFARYTVREIFSVKRMEIQGAIEGELRARLATDGVVLRSVQMGKVDLPADYRRGMERLLAEELESQKMQYTLELKDKRVRESQLEASADKARREVQAEAAAREQVIAAKGQEEAMKHVLPFKERQIEQRKLEAEAAKQTRVKAAEASAQSRRIEAEGEADARRQLAEVEAWRLDRVGRVNAEQMEREGAVVSRHPLLVQKTLADKLSDKIQVIIAPPPKDGFIGAGLLGGAQQSAGRAAAQHQAVAAQGQE